MQSQLRNKRKDAPRNIDMLGTRRVFDCRMWGMEESESESERIKDEKGRREMGKAP